jgi:RHS repeat-associated protein
LPFPLSNIPPFLGTRAVVEGATVVESYDFDPWGLLLPGRTLAGPTKEGFTGKEQDGETGLDYFGARYYMPALARWTAVDPLAARYAPWSPYNYVLNGPVAAIDPDGREVYEGEAAQAVFAYLKSHNFFQRSGRPGQHHGEGPPRGYYVEECEWHDISCLHSQLLRAASDGNWLKRRIARDAADALEAIGLVAWDDLSERAAEGDRVSQALLALGFVLAARPGGFAGRSPALPIPRVGNRKLQNIINDLYKGTRNPQRFGNGTTADAIRWERASGLPIHGRFHSTKGTQYVRALENWLSANPSASYRDRLVAQSILDDLRNALGGGP